ncbi:hypothetical protein KKE92_00425 [Candidatus Micrarchaeota archaeon]|nr:hypothetical protein [Candidatus Micrarchaeota archaeon]
MNGRGFRTFRNVSTFTYVGRNTSLYNRAFKYNDPKKEPLKILIAGPGPFEPFYVSYLGKHSIDAVDISPKMCDIIHGINNGAYVDMETLAEKCHNVNDDGKPRPNRDLSNSERVEQAAKEMAMQGFAPEDFLSGRKRFFRVMNPNADITTFAEDIFAFLEKKGGYDVVAMCTLFINLRKTLGDEELAKLFISFRKVMSCADRRDSGILAISETPAAIHGPRNVVGFMVDAGFTITDMIVDNLVNARGSLRGGYGIISRADGHLTRKRSDMDIRKLREEFDGGVFAGSGVSAIEMPDDALVSFLENTDRVVLAALRTSLEKMTVFTADKQKLTDTLPETRTSFGLSELEQ